MLIWNNMLQASYFIIFGAAVREDGSPSGSLYRRVAGAWQLSQALAPEQAKACRFIVTGGQGRYGPTEASVMQSLLLEFGADPQQIILEQQAADTMQSVFLCRDILLAQQPPAGNIIICSSPYHNYRCQLLLKMLGISARRGKMPSDRPALGVRKWLWYYFRELLAIPWDLLHILLIR